MLFLFFYAMYCNVYDASYINLPWNICHHCAVRNFIMEYVLTNLWIWNALFLSSFGRFIIFFPPFPLFVLEYQFTRCSRNFAVNFSDNVTAFCFIGQETYWKPLQEIRYSCNIELIAMSSRNPTQKIYAGEAAWKENAIRESKSLGATINSPVYSN